jgi:ABC-2 type transport system permease protein
MKIKNFKKTRQVVRATMKEQVQSESTYLGNFWFDVSSTVVFAIITLVFLDLLFKRVDTVAGYSKNDYIFMVLVGEFSFFAIAAFLVEPMVFLKDSVRNGYFDLMLLRPVPLKTYIYARAIRPLHTIMAALPNILLFVFAVNWSKLDISLTSIISGFFVWICGLIIFNTFMFALTIPVFTQGDSSDMQSAWYSVVSMNMMPYEKMPTFMKFFSLTLIPSILMTAGSAFVIMQKGNPVPVLISAFLATIVSLIIYRVMWRHALNNYTSASS